MSQFRVDEKTGLLNTKGKAFYEDSKAEAGVTREDVAFNKERQLNQVIGAVRDPLFRPFRWSEVLAVEAVGDLIDVAEYDQVEGAGEIAVMSQVHNPDDLPDAALKRNTELFQFLRYGNKIQYTDRELRRAAALGYNLSDGKARAQRRAWEQLLDNIAVDGFESGSVSLPGLNNAPGVTVLNGATKAAGGTSWTAGAGATAEEMLADLHELVSQVVIGSKENHTADLIVMSVADSQRMYSQRIPDTQQTVASRWMDDWAARRNGSAGRIVVWDKWGTAGVDGASRLVAMDSSDRDVAAMLMSSPYAVRYAEVRAFLTTLYAEGRVGGVRVLDPSGLKFMDLTAA